MGSYYYSPRSRKNNLNEIHWLLFTLERISIYLSGREDTQQSTQDILGDLTTIYKSTSMASRVGYANLLSLEGEPNSPPLLLPYPPPFPFLFFLTYYPLSSIFLGQFLLEDFKGMKGTGSQNVKVWQANGPKAEACVSSAPKITHWATQR